MASDSELAKEGAQLFDPVQAFDDLRVDVAELRQALEALPETLAENQRSPPIDYSEEPGTHCRSAKRRRRPGSTQ